MGCLRILFCLFEIAMILQGERVDILCHDFLWKLFKIQFLNLKYFGYLDHFRSTGTTTLPGCLHNELLKKVM